MGFPGPLLLTCALSASSLTLSDVDWTPRHAAVAELLAGHGPDGASLSRDQVVGRLIARGSEDLGPLFDVVGGRCEAPAAREGDGELGAGVRIAPVSDPQDVAAAVASGLPVETVLSAVTEWCGPEPELFDALQGMRFLRDVEDLRALDCMLGLLAEVDPVHLRRPFVRGQALEAMAKVATSDDRSTWFLTRAARKLAPPQLGLVVELVGGARGVEGVRLLREMLDLDPELDRAVVEALGHVSVRDVEVLCVECIDLVRPYLRAPSLDVRCAAVASLGRLGDHHSIPELIEVLDAGEPTAAVAARWALRELAGRSFDGPAAWHRWYDSEREWFELRLPQLVAVVRHARPGEMTTALRELVAHPLYRREVADVVEEILWHESDSLVEAACATLGQLGWPGAIDGLVAALEHPSEGVRSAAHASLVQIAGTDLPARPEAWRGWLEL